MNEEWRRQEVKTPEQDPLKRYDRVAGLGPLAGKLRRLERWLRARQSLLVAFSGGVDSSLLVTMASQVLGERVLAVTADSPTLPRADLRDAAALARHLKLRHRVIHTEEMKNPAFVANAADRCYHCKSELFAALAAMASREGLKGVADGSNADDRGDYRPGARAAREHGVLRPLQTLDFTKRDIRAASKALGLPTAYKPAAACLASRLPYGTPITPAALARIERAEAALHRAGFDHCRVRLHGDVARIELPAADLGRALAGRVAVVRCLKRAGLRYIALDLEGYRTGSMNEALR